VHSVQLLASLCTWDGQNNGNNGQCRNKTGCYGCTDGCLFMLCSVSVGALLNVFSNDLCESTAQWETCQIFKGGQTVGAQLAGAPVM
jgi:prenyltransferase beta subunit